MKNLKLLLSLLIVGSTLLMPSCKKKNEPAPAPAPTTPAPPTGGPTITSSFYFQAKIDGTWVTLQEGGYVGSGAGSAGGTVSTGVQEEQGVVISDILNSTGASFFILKTFATWPTGPEVESMFSIKSYSYGKTPNATNVDGIDGVGITYTDANGVDWRSDEGVGTQTGSTFSITEHIVNTDGFSHKISKATFSCKLYDSSGNVKTLTNGVLRGRSVSY